MSNKKYTPEQHVIAFWNKVDKDGSIPAHCPELGQCWEWTANTSPFGYGYKAWIDGDILVHRISWRLAYGSIPNNLQVLHKCDNRKCVRIDHLFLGTHQDNMKDRNNKGRCAKRDGINNPAARLNDDLVREIRKIYKNGETHLPTLAKKYGVSKNTIWMIVRNKTWKLV